MTSGIHHICCATTDPDAVVEFLQESMGLQLVLDYEVPGDVASALLGWPPCGSTRARMLGGPGLGAIEVIEIPTEISDQVTPGISLAAFGTRRLDDLLAKLGDSGTASTDVQEMHGDVNFRAASTTIGGIRFEFCEFGTTEP